MLSEFDTTDIPKITRTVHLLSCINCTSITKIYPQEIETGHISGTIYTPCHPNPGPGQLVQKKGPVWQATTDSSLPRLPAPWTTHVPTTPANSSKLLCPKGLCHTFTSALRTNASASGCLDKQGIHVQERPVAWSTWSTRASTVQISISAHPGALFSPYTSLFTANSPTGNQQHHSIRVVLP